MTALMSLAEIAVILREGPAFTKGQDRVTDVCDAAKTRALMLQLAQAVDKAAASLTPTADPAQVVIDSHCGDPIAAARGLGYIIRRDARGFYPAQDLETASRHGFHATREAAARFVVESVFL